MFHLWHTVLFFSFFFHDWSQGNKGGWGRVIWVLWPVKIISLILSSQNERFPEKNTHKKEEKTKTKNRPDHPQAELGLLETAMYDKLSC